MVLVSCTIVDQGGVLADAPVRDRVFQAAGRRLCCAPQAFHGEKEISKFLLLFSNTRILPACINRSTVLLLYPCTDQLQLHLPGLNKLPRFNRLPRLNGIPRLNTLHRLNEIFRLHTSKLARSLARLNEHSRLNTLTPSDMLSRLNVVLLRLNIPPQLQE